MSDKHIFINFRIINFLGGGGYGGGYGGSNYGGGYGKGKNIHQITHFIHSKL